VFQKDTKKVFFKASSFFFLKSNIHYTVPFHLADHFATVLLWWSYALRHVVRSSRYVGERYVWFKHGLDGR